MGECPKEEQILFANCRSWVKPGTAFAKSCWTRLAGLQTGPPALEVSDGWAPCPTHQLAGRAVLVGFIQVALAIVGLHQPPQLPIQGYVGHIIRGEDQQVRCLLTPADLLLGKANPVRQQPAPAKPMLHPSPCTWSQPHAWPAADPLALIRRVPRSCPPSPGTKTKYQEPIQHFPASPSNTLI